MSSFFLSVIYVVLYWALLSSSTAKPRQKWFTFTIKNQSDPATQQIISNAIQQLSSSGVFHLQNFLSPIAINFLKREIDGILTTQDILEESYKSRERSTNIFSDFGDDHYSSTHPRNTKQMCAVTGVPRYQLTDPFIDLYLYKPLINFMKTVVTSTKHLLPFCDPWSYDCKQWKDLITGSTKEVTSLYLQVLFDGNFGNYHLLDEGFTCSFVINEAEFGGEFIYKFVAPKPKQRQHSFETTESLSRGWDFEWDWKLIKKVIQERIEVNSFTPKSGDVYCVKGNITLHRIDHVEGDNTRTDIVMSYWEENPALTGPVQEIQHFEL